ncbi:MAG: desulfoferrodoxin [Proteobacteria bacterium]|jgi:superoxide reductase|nr:desulfoferrodoxin [Pseudomonadota bacterium]NLN63372.1 desulfoferrodoxin [Myxococcales bacterium]
MATQKRDLYRCDRCGNIVEVLHASAGTLVCCGQPMTKQAENTQDASTEKHVPMIEKTDKGYRVTVGSVAHPMDDDHYIQWIELVACGVSNIRFLKPGDPPVAEFCCVADEVTARAYCNLHGFWKNA